MAGCVAGELGQLMELGNMEGWGLCSGSVEPTADVGRRGEAAVKATGSESHGVLCVGIWRSLGSSDFGIPGAAV